MKRQITVKVGTVVTLWMQILEAIRFFALLTCFFWQDFEQKYECGVQQILFMQCSSGRLSGKQTNCFVILTI